MMKLPSFPILLLSAVVSLMACHPKVQFEEPMPPGRFNLPNIPKAFRGEIVDGDDVWRIGKDTIGFADGVMVNGQDFLLRRMAGHLVMSHPVTETGHWEVIVLKREGDAFRTAGFEDDQAMLTRMATLLEAPLEHKKSGGYPEYSYVLLSPTAKEFRAILKEGLYELEEGAVPLPRGDKVRPSAPPPPSN